MADGFVAIPDEIFEMDLSSPAFRLFAVMTKRSDWDTGEVFESRATLAKALGMNRAASVDQYVRELESAGLISVRARWMDADGNTSFERSATFKSRTSSLVKVLRRWSRTPEGVVRQSAQGVIRQTVQYLEILLDLLQWRCLTIGNPMGSIGQWRNRNTSTSKLS